MFKGISLTGAVNVLSQQVARSDLPIEDQRIREIKERALKTEIGSHASVVPLLAPSDWSAFAESFAYKHGNCHPWYRCLSVLRGFGAKCALIEPHYVCLDHRSEVSYFYAGLDAPRKGFTKRIHFFDNIVETRKIGQKSFLKEASYLGYIVTREGDLPLVGRALIKTPCYISEATAVDELVNLYGCRLHIRGVPFMQQDARFANCAHVASWIIHYTAFRRGVSSRRVIGEIVQEISDHSGGAPTPDGLSLPELSMALRRSGLNPSLTYLPSLLDPTVVSAVSLPAGTIWNRLEEAEKEVVTQGNPQEESLSRDVFEAVTDSLRLPPSDFPEGSDGYPQAFGDEPSFTLLDKALDELIHPYIASGWPVIVGVHDHVWVACGRSVTEGKLNYYMHDDQLGPYLPCESLSTQSVRGLELLSGYRTPLISSSEDLSDPAVVPGSPEVPIDLALSRANGSAPAGNLEEGAKNEPDYGATSLVFAAPRRVSHSLHTAKIATMRVLGSSAGMSNSSVDGSEGYLRTCVLMGIDYRLDRLRKAKTATARRVFSSVHLPEWVTVVEHLTVLDGESRCDWEIVFDASSGDDQMRIMFMWRDSFAATISAVHSGIEVTKAKFAPIEALRIPGRVGKVHSHPELSR